VLKTAKNDLFLHIMNPLELNRSKAFFEQDYYPFGMLEPGRNFALYSDTFHYAFNGKYKDDDIEGSANIYDYGFRMYDSRLCRFISVDPLFQKYPYYSTYEFAGLRPIKSVDVEGLETPANLAGELNGSSPMVQALINPDVTNHASKAKEAASKMGSVNVTLSEGTAGVNIKVGNSVNVKAEVKGPSVTAGVSTGGNVNVTASSGEGNVQANAGNTKVTVVKVNGPQVSYDSKTNTTDASIVSVSGPNVQTTQSNNSGGTKTETTQSVNSSGEVTVGASIVAVGVEVKADLNAIGDFFVQEGESFISYLKSASTISQNPQKYQVPVGVRPH